MASVTTSVHNSILVATISNPPVNALNSAVRSGLISALDILHADRNLLGMLIVGDSRNFSGGADIKEFGKAPIEPTLRQVISAVEESPKPVAVLLSGNTLGGGLELSLGARVRYGSKSARIGLPEVKIGLIPGAGGTQRLPRISNSTIAIRMIVFGEAIDASEANSAGILDQIVDEFSVESVAEIFEKRIRTAQLPTLARERPLPGDLKAALEQVRAKVSRERRQPNAARAALASIEEGIALEFRDGLKNERRLFEICMNGEESRALRHVFFAERGMRHPRPERQEIQNVAIVGAGTMGTGIALSIATAGFKVKLIDENADARERARKTLDAFIASDDTKKQNPIERHDDPNLIEIAGSVSDAYDADLVIEAVFEEVNLKRSVFSSLETIARKDAILATNTSYIDIDTLAAATNRRDRVVGMHFFAPANVMRLLEVVKGAATSNETLTAVCDFGRRIKKLPVVVGNCHGFVGNRMLVAYSREANRLLLEGALPSEVDLALEDFGMAMGPLAVSDLAGLDIGWRRRKALREQGDGTVGYWAVADRLVESGRLGRKTGFGFYQYTTSNGRQKREDDPFVESLIQSMRRERGSAARNIERQEIVERCITALIIEGGRVLEEGFASASSDIDLIYVHGYGFPAWRGGPMHYADTVGLRAIFDTAQRWAKQLGSEWEPPHLLAKLAADSSTFGAIARGRAA